MYVHYTLELGQMTRINIPALFVFLQVACKAESTLLEISPSSCQSKRKTCKSLCEASCSRV